MTAPRDSSVAAWTRKGPANKRITRLEVPLGDPIGRIARHVSLPSWWLRHNEHWWGSHWSETCTQGGNHALRPPRCPDQANHYLPLHRSKRKFPFRRAIAQGSEEGSTPWAIFKDVPCWMSFDAFDPLWPMQRGLKAIRPIFHHGQTTEVRWQVEHVSRRKPPTPSVAVLQPRAKLRR